MKKMLALALVLVMLAAVMPLAASAADAQTVDSLTVQFPDVAGITFTFTDVLDQYYYDPAFQYGAITYLFFGDNATISWDKEVKIQYQGAPATKFTAGETYSISDLDGYYFYNDDSSMFYFFCKMSGQYGAAAENVNGSLKDYAVAAAAETTATAAEAATETTTAATTSAATSAAAAGAYDSSMGTYTVAPGDCLWTICVAIYGNGAKWGEVWAANSDIIANPRLIYVGQVLKIPK